MYKSLIMQFRPDNYVDVTFISVLDIQYNNIITFYYMNILEIPNHQLLYNS